jgi:mono/diheme cytochrome c family protein
MGPRLGRHANVSMPRHHLVMAQGVPAPYASMTNPLPGNRASVERGASIYAQRCVTCHGVYGHGDGEAGRNLTPPPGNLAWLSQIGLGRQVAYLYWTVAEGGVPLGSGMPAFKDALSAEEIWAVIAYIQDRLPQSSK